MKHIISPPQCRAARGLLDWSQPDLAKHCGMHVQTICAFEHETSTPTKRTLEKIINTFEKNGLEFTSGDGVKKTENPILVLYGEEELITLFDDIYQTVKNHKRKEVLIGNISEKDFYNKEIADYLNMHIQRLEKSKIKEKILCCDGDKNFITNKSYYRWLPKKYFYDSPTFIYGDKVALLKWSESIEITIINNEQYAKSVGNLFYFCWEKAQIPD